MRYVYTHTCKTVPDIKAMRVSKVTGHLLITCPDCNVTLSSSVLGIGSMRSLLEVMKEHRTTNRPTANN